MIDERAKRILLEEIASWHREGLITDDQRDILAHRYGALADLPEELARRAEGKASTLLTVLMAAGGGLIVLGVLFLVSTFWRDLGELGQHAVSWGPCLLAYGVAHQLFAKQRYPRSTVALAAIGNVLLVASLAVTWDAFGLDRIEEHSVTFTGLLCAVYLALSLRTGSQLLGMFFGVALVTLFLAVGFTLFDLTEEAGVIYCSSVGVLPVLGALLLSSTPGRFLTPALGTAGLGMVFVSSLIGTWMPDEQGVYLFSYFLLFVVPLGTTVLGSSRESPGLVYLGIAILWVSLIRMFADVFEDAVPVFIASIFVGVLTIAGAILYERRRGKGAAAAAVPDAGGIS